LGSFPLFRLTKNNFGDGPGPTPGYAPVKNNQSRFSQLQIKYISRFAMLLSLKASCAIRIAASSCGLKAGPAPGFGDG
jgi:hypothetical protein